jgi:hypothetical protein
VPPKAKEESHVSEAPLRRSSRVRKLQAAGPSVTSAAQSNTSIDLPQAVIGTVDETTKNLASKRAASRGADKNDLATVTRANTRRNKGSAVPPNEVLRRQKENPSTRLDELKSIHDARAAKKNAGGGTKSVRFRESLAEYQGEEEEEQEQREQQRKVEPLLPQPTPRPASGSMVPVAPVPRKVPARGRTGIPKLAAKAAVGAAAKTDEVAGSRLARPAGVRKAGGTPVAPRRSGLRSSTK